MPSLAAEALFLAAPLMCDHPLNGAHNISQAQSQSILEALLTSPHKETAQFSQLISDMELFLATAPPGHGT